MFESFGRREKENSLSCFFLGGEPIYSFLEKGWAGRIKGMVINFVPTQKGKGTINLIQHREGVGSHMGHIHIKQIDIQ